MAITGIGTGYNNNVYESTYASKSNGTEQVAETSKTSTDAQESTRSTAADELSYLSEKYSNYSFVAANYSKGMRYGSSSTVNVAISPQFLQKMANDPELEKEYEENIAAMQECDEQFRQMQAARGWRVDAQGWAIDKDGGISSWTIVTKDPNAKSYLQEMSENAEKIREKNAEKKKQQKDVEEKRQTSREEAAELKEIMQSAGKEQFGDRFKEAAVLTSDDKETDAGRKEKEKEAEVGINLDMKI